MKGSTAIVHDFSGCIRPRKVYCSLFLSLVSYYFSFFYISPREGLVDITNDPDFYGIYDEDMNEDPTYEPNSPEEKAIFMKYAENIMLKLTFSTTQVQQHENVFIFETDYWLTNAIKYTQDYLDICTYQRLQQRLYLQKKVIQKHFEKKKEIRKGMGYLKLICFLIPFLLSLKKKMKVPYLNSLLPPFSGKRISKNRPHLGRVSENYLPNKYCVCSHYFPVIEADYYFYQMM